MQPETPGEPPAVRNVPGFYATFGVKEGTTNRSIWRRSSERRSGSCTTGAKGAEYAEPRRGLSRLPARQRAAGLHIVVMTCPSRGTLNEPLTRKPRRS